MCQWMLLIPDRWRRSLLLHLHTFLLVHVRSSVIETKYRSAHKVPHKQTSPVFGNFSPYWTTLSCLSNLHQSEGRVALQVFLSLISSVSLPAPSLQCGQEWILSSAKRFGISLESDEKSSTNWSHLTTSVQLQSLLHICQGLLEIRQPQAMEASTSWTGGTGGMHGIRVKGAKLMKPSVSICSSTIEMAKMTCVYHM